MLFENIDSVKDLQDDDNQTVGYKNAIQRVKKLCGVDLKQYETYIDELGRVRNQIQHYKCSINGEYHKQLIRALEKKEQESIEATKKLIAQRKELEKRKKAEESKKRTHRLCQIGGAVESVLGCPIEEEDLPKLIGFLKRQETNGKFFSKAMQKEPLTDMEEV